MIIYTITCHDVYNYGASLQAYALMKYLGKLGNDVQIIDYKPEYLSKHYYLWSINPKFKRNIITKGIYLLIKVPGRIARRFERRKREFDKFKKYYLKVTPNRYSSNEELKKLSPEADLYIAGSDQIWNPLFENGRDPAFFLDFAPNDKKKISYAASFSVDDVPEEYRVMMSKYLKKLDAISVREQSGVEVLKQLGVNNGKMVLDPVFLLTEQEWSKLCDKNIDDKYIFVYDFDKNGKIKEAALSLAHKYNLKIYSGLKCEYADKTFEDFGPKQFLSLVKNAEFVVTNSFHATAFSVIFKRSFYVFNRDWKINTRMRDLLNSLGNNTSRRLVEELPKDIQEISWSEVTENLDVLIQKSKEYLNDCLKAVTNDK